MRRFRLIGCLVPLLLLSGCENNSFISSVPAYPVHVEIDTRMGAFVHFVPTAFGSFVVANRDGYFMNGNYISPPLVTDAYGYGGVLVYVGMNGYDAYDLACPYCAISRKRQPCLIDGIYAICPECGECYDIGSGTAVPTKGIAKEPMRRLNINNIDGKLTILQR